MMVTPTSIRNAMIKGPIGCAALVLVLAGCASATGAAAPGSSAGAKSGASATPGSRQLLAIYRELAQCIRQHGQPNLPDPVVNPSTGKVELPPGTQKPSRAAMDACKSIADRLPPSENNRPPVTAADMVKLRALARCMRAHGLNDWPDPNADGSFPLPTRLFNLGKKGIITQIQACKQYYPNGKISIQAPAGSNG
jgi:hypothetical protein